MDEAKKPEQQAQVVQGQDLEALIALVEERVMDNLAQIIERIMQAQGGIGNGNGGS